MSDTGAPGIRPRGGAWRPLPKGQFHDPYTNQQRGDLGELISEQVLDHRLGYEVYRDWDKRGNQSGYDTIAYDPKTDRLYLIDNKAQKVLINGAPALMPRRIPDNVAAMKEILDKNSGFSERARAAALRGDVDLVVSNAHPGNLNTPFSPQIFQRGWLVLDVATGGIYSSAQHLMATRRVFFPPRVPGRPAPGPSGQQGFATVGGILFTLVSLGGLVFAMKDIRNLEGLTAFAAQNLYAGGVGFLAGRLTGSGGVGVILGMIVTMKNDHGEPSEQDLQQEQVSDFLRQHFSTEELRANPELEAEAWMLLFGTTPWVLAPDGAIGDTVVKTIEELRGGQNPKVLFSSVMAALASPDVALFVAALASTSREDGTTYLSLLQSVLREEFGNDVSSALMERLVPDKDARDAIDGVPLLDGPAVAAAADPAALRAGDSEDASPQPSGNENDATQGDDSEDLQGPRVQDDSDDADPSAAATWPATSEPQGFDSDGDHAPDMTLGADSAPLDDVGSTSLDGAGTEPQAAPPETADADLDGAAGANSSQTDEDLYSPAPDELADDRETYEPAYDELRDADETPEEPDPDELQDFQTPTEHEEPQPEPEPEPVVRPQPSVVR